MDEMQLLPNVPHKIKINITNIRLKGQHCGIMCKATACNSGYQFMSQMPYFQTSSVLMGNAEEGGPDVFGRCHPCRRPA